MTVEEILKKLVSFSILGGQSNIAIAEWIENYLTTNGVAYTNVPNSYGTKRSIHCRIGPPEDGGVIFIWTYGCCSGRRPRLEKTNPFELTDIGDGKLYGRGSCDMKGFLACCLASLPKIVGAKT